MSNTKYKRKASGGANFMKKNIVAIAGLTLGLAVLNVAPQANAHHGFAAHFDPDNIVRIEGTIKQYDFINPHSYLHIDTFDEDGEPIVYRCDLQARTHLMRHGHDETLFTVGESIVVLGFQARRDPHSCEYGVGYFEDGTSFTMRTIDEAESQFAPGLATTSEEIGQESIFGNWIRPDIYDDYESGREPIYGLGSVMIPGEAARSVFDPIMDNPVIHCESGSPIRSWGAVGLATSISMADDQVIIYHETMDATRIVHLGMTEHPADIVPSDLGHSIGYFEGDTLVVDSIGFSAGVLNGANQNSEQMTMKEWISFDEESGRLLIEFTVIDRRFYNQDIVGAQYLQPTANEVLPYECLPEGREVL